MLYVCTCVLIFLIHEYCFFFITVGITICQRIKTCKLVMFIIALVTVVVAVIGIIVPSVMTRQVQPDLSASGMASPE